MPPPTIEERFRIALQRAAARSVGGGAKLRSLPVLLHDDVPTFMEVPHYCDVKTSDLVVVGVSYESIRAQDPRNFVLAGYPLRETIYAKEGAFEAPDEIRRHSIHYSLEHGPGGYYPERDREFHIADTVSICDAGNLPIDMSHPAEEILNGASDRLLELIQPDRVPIILGGEDIVPYVGVRAVARERNAKISVIKFDQHFDLCWEPRYWAGSAWARCMEANYLQPENLALIGIRGLSNSHLLSRGGARPWDRLLDADGHRPARHLRLCDGGDRARHEGYRLCLHLVRYGRYGYGMYAGPEISGASRHDGARNPARPAADRRSWAAALRFRH